MYYPFNESKRLNPPKAAEKNLFVLGHPNKLNSNTYIIL